MFSKMKNKIKKHLKNKDDEDKLSVGDFFKKYLLTSNKKSSKYISLSSEKPQDLKHFDKQSVNKFYSKLEQIELKAVDFIQAEEILERLKLIYYSKKKYLVKRKRKIPEIKNKDIKRIKVINFHQNNYSFQEISKILNISRQKVRNIIKSYNIENRIALKKPGPSHKIDEKKLKDIEMFYTQKDNVLKAPSFSQGIYGNNI